MTTLLSLFTQRSLLLCLILLLNACASTSNTATVLKQATQRLSIGPYPSFSGRLIVFDTSRRWQVSIDWQATQAATGKLRLSHALSGTVVDFRWTENNMQVRDNKSPNWHPINQQKLTEYGIVLPPSQMASILLGQTPSHFLQIKHDTWESIASGSPIRVRWQDKLHTLTINDMKHHRTAKLIIKNHANITRSR